MFSGKSVRQYVARIIADLDSGKTPKRPRTPLWVRRLAAPSAFGLTLAFAGCDVGPAEQGEVTREMASAAKADGFTDFLCIILDEEPGCDLCDVLGWYGDDFCDEFCDQPDPDCGPVLLYAAPLPDGECWTDADCADGERCEGASTCPEGAYCIIAPHTGTCVPQEPQCARDTDCAENEQCVVTGSCPEGAYCIYAPQPGSCQPFAEGCSNGSDNDGDGTVDCDDSDCALEAACQVQALYSVPFEVETACDDGADNDLDGAIDCEDTDCAESSACQAHRRYAAPFGQP